MSTQNQLDNLINELRQTSSKIAKNRSLAHRSVQVSNNFGRYDASRKIALNGGSDERKFQGSETRVLPDLHSQVILHEQKTSNSPNIPDRNILSRDPIFRQDNSCIEMGVHGITQTLPTKTYRTTYKTTLNRVPLVNRKVFSPINIKTENDQSNCHASSMTNRHFSTSSTFHDNLTSPFSTTSTQREQWLLEELMRTREELESIKRTSFLSQSSLKTPATVPVQRRSLFTNGIQYQTSNTAINRRFNGYLSNTDVRRSENWNSSHSRTNNQDYMVNVSSGLPKRAMSSANIQGGNWCSSLYNASSVIQSPTVHRSSMNSIPASSGYSARRERLRAEAERRQIEFQKLNSENRQFTLRDLSNRRRPIAPQSGRLQHYQSMSAIKPERETFEETESITLQPIGKGVHDLGSNIGSTFSLARRNRAASSSMVEGLNRTNFTPIQRPKTLSRTLRTSKNDEINLSTSERLRITTGKSQFQHQIQVHNSDQISTSLAASPVTRQKISNHSPEETKLANDRKVSSTQTPVLSNISIVQDTASIWYRLNFSRQEAIAFLKHLPAGSFLIRESTTYKDAYGLAVKVDSQRLNSPPSAGNADIDVRHYLIETVNSPTSGVRIKGFSIEPVFPSLVSLIYEHTLFPLALPCCLVLPHSSFRTPPSIYGSPHIPRANGFESNTSTVQNRQSLGSDGIQSNYPRCDHAEENFLRLNIDGFGTQDSGKLPTPLTNGGFTAKSNEEKLDFTCNCIYLGCEKVNSATGEEGIMKAVNSVLNVKPNGEVATASTTTYAECRMLVSKIRGILLSDLNKKLFIQLHFSRSSIVFSGIDVRNKMLLGIIIRKNNGELICHVLTECDPTHTAVVIVEQINQTFGEFAK